MHVPPAARCFDCNQNSNVWTLSVIVKLSDYPSAGLDVGGSLSCPWIRVLHEKLSSRNSKDCLYIPHGGNQLFQTPGLRCLLKQKPNSRNAHNIQ